MPGSALAPGERVVTDADASAIGKADARAIRVDTPTATLGVRGTDFIVRVD